MGINARTLLLIIVANIEKIDLFTSRFNCEADLVNSVKNLYWVIVTIIYLSVSFSTGAWHISWLIWLIATAIEQALTIIFSIKYDSKNTRNSETNID